MQSLMFDTRSTQPSCRHSVSWGHSD